MSPAIRFSIPSEYGIALKLATPSNGKTVTTQLLKARTLAVSIGRPPDQVYDFVSDPRNLPRWSFFRSVTRSGDQWVVDTPDGPVGLRFVEANELGVLDHYVKLGSGVEIHVPMRVIPNGQGSEVLFTLLQTPDMTEEEFAEDAKQVERDLATLKAVLEDAGTGRRT
jgi:hypothetical protein